MKPFPLSALIGSLVLAAQSGCSNEGNQQVTESAADYVLMNGRIYTVDDENPWAEVLGVRDGELVYVGDAAGAPR